MQETWKALAVRLIQYGVLIALFVGMFVVSFWRLYPYEPIRIRSLTIKQTGLLPRQYVIMEMSYCKTESYRSMLADVRLSLRDTVIWPMEQEYTEPLLTGCHVQQDWIRIPEVPPENHYHIDMTRVYHVNAMRDVSVSATSNAFQILPSPQSDISRAADAVRDLARADEELRQRMQRAGDINSQLLKALRVLGEKVDALTRQR
jgi:hypothetical protein